jgi:hypothetical protein
MSKRNKIIYWIATAWLALGMLSTAAVQLARAKAGAGGMDSITHLGYPEYFVTILGAWKISGVIAVLIPKFTLVKEWAYAGFFFAMTGAILSHLACGDAASEFFGPTLLLMLTIASWYFRPAERKSFSVINK